jgi:hypothetical protein
MAPLAINDHTSKMWYAIIPAPRIQTPKITSVRRSVAADPSLAPPVDGESPGLRRCGAVGQLGHDSRIPLGSPQIE